MRTSHIAKVAAVGAAIAMLAACGSNPSQPVQGPVGAYPISYSAGSQQSLEYGRVTNIEYFQGGAPRSGPNVGGAVTLFGGIGGAAVGIGVGRTFSPAPNPVYRVSVQTDQGDYRSYDVPATGDLRVGDRVRVENGVIYRA